jgi:Predicted ATPase with chaperone activity
VHTQETANNGSATERAARASPLGAGGLRQAIEDGEVTISRVNASLSYPIMLVAAMNPCPCGYYGDPIHQCSCTPVDIRRYLKKIPGRYPTDRYQPAQ